MSAAVADRPEQPAQLHLSLTGLILQVGNKATGHCYKFVLEPEVASQLAADLMRQVALAERAGHEASIELSGILGKPDA